MAQEIRSLIIYGPHLFRESLPLPAGAPPLTIHSGSRTSLSLDAATKLASILQNVTPLSSTTVVVPSAFLSFDVKGIPFLEPCYANCIVQGYNDHGEWERSVEKQGEKGHANGEADVRKSEVYKEWVWSRCCTSAEYEGDLPHPLEVSYLSSLLLPGTYSKLSTSRWSGNALRTETRRFRSRARTTPCRLPKRAPFPCSRRLRTIRQRRSRAYSSTEFPNSRRTHRFPFIEIEKFPEHRTHATDSAVGYTHSPTLYGPQADEAHPCSTDTSL